MSYSQGLSALVRNYHTVVYRMETLRQAGWVFFVLGQDVPQPANHSLPQKPCLTLKRVDWPCKERSGACGLSLPPNVPAVLPMLWNSA